MIEALKLKIKESDRPVGEKRPSPIKLPPPGHTYGLEIKKDPENASIGKIIYLTKSRIILIDSKYMLSV